MKMGESARRRAGIAGIVATIIIFAILFTVGTSYFVFVNGLNAAYVKNLVAAQGKTSGAGAESLLITTVLLANGDVGFYANNTSGESVNMTAVYLPATDGSMLKCDGVGLAAAGGCANTVPPLWVVVNVGKGSATLDTGYLFVTA